MKSIKQIVFDIEDQCDKGAPIEEVLETVAANGLDREKAERELEKMMQKAEVYEANEGHLRTA